MGKARLHAERGCRSAVGVACSNGSIARGLMMSAILRLAQEQLDAYNGSDLDRFAQCYHAEVVVFQNEELSFRGRGTLRARYADLFSRWTFGATVSQQLHLGSHCIDLEDWWRVNPDTSERTSGRVLVRYQLGDGLIARVQFLTA